jgi:hypothetical protein
LVKSILPEPASLRVGLIERKLASQMLEEKRTTFCNLALLRK